MTMRTGKITAVILAFVFLGSQLAFSVNFAQISELKGKVEVRAAGATDWIPAEQGMNLGPKDSISTGFNGTATLKIGDNTLVVKSLTRLTLDKLASQGSTASTTAFLKVGSVDATIKSAEGVKQDFKIQSTYSTASVRGTAFSFDGVRLKVREGRVAFIPGPRPRITIDTDEILDLAEEAAEAEGTLIAEGTSAQVTIAVDGTVQAPTTSNSIEGLRQGSGLQGLPPITAGGFVPPKTTGGVKVTLTRSAN